MMKPKQLLWPIYGILVFFMLYVLASFYYPGGSQADKTTIGFSWMHNYWCNLLDSQAINGQVNPAKPIALLAMIILCASLAFFWYVFPQQVGLGRAWRKTVQISGILAAVVAGLLFTKINHDLITNVASLFGLVAIAGTFIGLYRLKFKGLFLFGVFNMFLVLLNNFLYHSTIYIYYLPLVQKVSFASFLAWISWISYRLYLRKSTST
jgi:hypothetical protein